jgi:hypothetical protein
MASVMSLFSSTSSVREWRSRIGGSNDSDGSGARSATLPRPTRPHPAVRSTGWAAILATAFFAFPGRAHAVRPFITDDARVVGGGYLQLETWVLFDADHGEHWVTFGFGPLGPLELTAGFVWGVAFAGERQGAGIQGPLLQLKSLLHPTRADHFPGIALTVGTLAPTGAGTFGAVAWTSYAYLALSQSFFADDLLIHVNIGLSVQNRGPTHPQFISGLGFQARLLGPFALVAEIVVGDVLDPEVEGGSVQAGYRLLLSDDLQLDGTFGADLWGEGRGWWVTAGIRVVAPRFYDPEASLPGHALQ